MLLSGVFGVLLTLAGCAYGNYFVTFPNTLRPGTAFIVEVSYTGTQSGVNVEASMGISGQAPVDRRIEPIQNKRAVISLNIPSLVNGNPLTGSYTLTVVGRVGSTEVFRNDSNVQIKSENSLLLVQTDKPMYKPKQTVRFRVVGVNEQLQPLSHPTDISIFDQNDNKLEEWLAVTSASGVIEKSYMLSDLPPLGKWRIQVKNEFASNTKEFSVEKYVLPKFDVNVEVLPSKLVQGEDATFVVKVTAKYTYGKPVLGKATYIFGSASASGPEPIRPGTMKTETEKLAGREDGTHEKTFELADLQSYIIGQTLMLTVNVTEDATMVTQQSDEIEIPVYRQKTKMEFLPTSSQVYRPGLAVELHLKVTKNTDNSPAHPNHPVVITSYINGSQVKRTVNVDNDGKVVATFQIPEKTTDRYDLSFNAVLQVDGKNTLNAYHSVSLYRTKLNTMLTVNVPTDQPVSSAGQFSVEIQTTAVLSDVVYMVLSRGVVVDSNKVDMGGMQSKTISISTDRKMTPTAHVIVYGIVSDGETDEIIADSVDVDISGVFQNSVSLEFSKKKGRAGDPVDVTVRSDAGSSYYILAVDKSVLLLGTGNDLSRRDVVNGLRDFGLSKTPTDLGPEPHGRNFAGDFIMPRQNNAPTSAGQILKKKGLVYLSGIVVEDSPPEQEFPMLEMAGGNGEIMFKNNQAEGPPQASPDSNAPKTQYAEVGKVRKFFPEAWLWMDGTVGASGIREFTQNIPDTITEWVATAFVMNSQSGLAITEQSARLTSFQPFFVSTTLPYAMTRGEIFQLRVTVFNYMEQSTPVKVTLKKSDDFGVLEKNKAGNVTVVSKDVVEEVQVAKNVPKSLIFEISAKKLGTIKLNVIAQPDASTGEKGDSIVENVLVKPEGNVVRLVHGETVELDADNTQFSAVVPLMFPNDTVKGSRRVEVKVTGDVMGPTVEGLEGLIRMPYGCGEQNMITLVPNIVVFNYLNTVNRLTQPVEDRAIANMKAGYQRELQYLRSDNSFSAFGNSDDSGSTWLTAFVMKCFSQARHQITVDTKIMRNSFTWLKSHQQKDGTFASVGHVHHTEMLGGSSKGKPLAAFIYIALKESESFLSREDEAVLTKTKTYLENLVRNNQLDTTYQMAIVSYALTLADSGLATQLLQKLEAMEDKPWQITEEETPKEVPAADGRRAMFYAPREATASDIETWSYVLLAYAKRGDVVLGRPIMKWLINNQNDIGGFRGTQDTVLGLQALADYASVVYGTPQTNINVTVRANSDSHTFTVMKDKLLLLQSYKFPEDTTSLDISATGNGLAIVKVQYQYNMLSDVEGSSGKKRVDVKVDSNKINDDLYRIRACFKSDTENLGMTYMSLQPQTQMSVANMDELSKEKNIKRVDFIDNQLDLYYDQPLKDFQCANVLLQRDAPVANIQPATLTARIYYQPEIQQQVLYTIEKSEEIDICEVCVDDGCPESCVIVVDCETCGDNCPESCKPPEPPVDCKTCGKNCPKSCETSSSKMWKVDAMLMSAALSLVFGVIRRI